MNPRILLVDNVDSFTFNLYQYLGELTGQAPMVVTNAVTRDELAELEYDCIVISPGPGHPNRHRDFGICPWLIEHATVPILGICLGHQGIGAHFGATVALAPEPMHGRASIIQHTDDCLFQGIPTEFEVIRYHSLLLREIPDSLEVIAQCGPLVMAIRHREKPIWGVQFHPESIGTHYGKRLLRNFVEQVPSTHHGTQKDSPDSKSSPADASVETLTLLHREMALSCDADALFATCFAGFERSFWLDSLEQSMGMGRFSYLGGLDGPLSSHFVYRVAQGQWVKTDGDETEAGPALSGLRRIFSRYRLLPTSLEFDFQGGLLGYLGYELKAETEGRPVHQSALPDAQMFFVDRFCVIDHQENTLFVCALASHDAHSVQREWVQSMSDQISKIAPVPLPEIPPTGTFGPRASQAQYLDQIDRSLTEIRHGETYEVCLTTQWVGPPMRNPLDVYRVLRTAHAVPFAAYLSMDELRVGSVSPERFLRVDATGLVQAKPIKGTAARSSEPDADLKAANDLRRSEKDQAENLMIVDLLRNDLGRVCELGSVHVPHLMSIESYAVHQMVSTVEGQLSSDHDVFDLLASAFPGGSMTGAPKARTMDIIDGLEGAPRGVYSGSIGYISLTGSADFNIVIRTLVMTKKESSVGVGGAVVALSNPENEWSEVLLKVSTVLDALSDTSRRDGLPKKGEASPHQ